MSSSGNCLHCGLGQVTHPLWAPLTQMETSRYLLGLLSGLKDSAVVSGSVMGKVIIGAAGTAHQSLQAPGLPHVIGGHGSWEMRPAGLRRQGHSCGHSTWTKPHSWVEEGLSQACVKETDH